MYRFSVMLEDNQIEEIREVASAERITVGEYIRRAIQHCALINGKILSGATVLGVYARTTSGDVQITRGF